MQRVSEAQVSIEGEVVGAIGLGQVVLVGVRHADTETDAEAMARKVFALRIFEDDAGKMNLAAADVGASFLAISQIHPLRQYQPWPAP